MRGGLPRLQRQYQSTLWNLWVLCLLPNVGGLLQWGLHRCEFGFEKLRRLRKYLPRIDPGLQSGDMRQLPTVGDALQRYLCLPSARQRQLRRVWQCMP